MKKSIKANNKNVKTIVITILIIILIIIAIGSILILNKKNKTPSILNIGENDVKYFILEKNGMLGVIDNTGKTIIEPKYAKIDIPNPTTDVFICLEDMSKTNYKAINSNGENLFNQYDSTSAIEINELSSYVPYEKSILRYKEANNYGLIDFKGKKITDAIYEEISSIEYKEGFLKVKKNGKYGVINIAGKAVIPADYDDITSDGYYNNNVKYTASGFILRTKTDNGYKYGYANKQGKVIIEPMYDELNRINEIENEKDVYLTFSVNGKEGLIKNKKQIIECKYDDIEYDSNANLLILNDNSKYGVCDLSGNQILPIEYDSISFGGDYINTTKNDEKKIFDLKGNALNTNFISHKQVNENCSIVIDNNGLYNIVDNSNNKLLKEDYIYIEEFNGDLFIATDENATGIINSKGNVIVKLEYSSVQKIKDTELLEAIKNDGTIDIIQKNGEIKSGIKDATLIKKDNYIMMYSKNDVKYFDLNGNATNYKTIVPGNTLYASNKNGKWGFDDANGQNVIKNEYDMVTEFSSGFAGICKNGKWGVINEQGQTIIEPKYEKNLANRKFLSEYYEIPNNVGVSIYSDDM